MQKVCFWPQGCSAEVDLTQICTALSDTNFSQALFTHREHQGRPALQQSKLETPGNLTAGSGSMLLEVAALPRTPRGDGKTSWKSGVSFKNHKWPLHIYTLRFWRWPPNPNDMVKIVQEACAFHQYMAPCIPDRHCAFDNDKHNKTTICSIKYLKCSV